MIRFRNPRRIKQTKIFIQAKTAGATTLEAKQLAGFSHGVSVTQIMDTPIAQALLSEMFKEDAFKDVGLVKRLKEMWTKKRVRHQKVGDDVIEVHEDDTDMWKYSMDRVLQLRGYMKNGKGDDLAGTIEATGGITFNVLQVPSEQKPKT